MASRVGKGGLIDASMFLRGSGIGTSLDPSWTFGENLKDFMLQREQVRHKENIRGTSVG